MPKPTKTVSKKKPKPTKTVPKKKSKPTKTVPKKKSTKFGMITNRLDMLPSHLQTELLSDYYRPPNEELRKEINVPSPVVVRYHNIGGYSTKYYNAKGQLHRIGGPAWIEIDEYSDEDGDPQVSTQFEGWYKNGKEHGTCGEPAAILNHCGQRITWMKHGKLHRSNDLPAVVNTCTHVVPNYLDKKEWYKNDKLHRSNDKPAEIEYNVDGSIANQSWWVDGKKIR